MTPPAAWTSVRLYSSMACLCTDPRADQALNPGLPVTLDASGGRKAWSHGHPEVRAPGPRCLLAAYVRQPTLVAHLLTSLTCSPPRAAALMPAASFVHRPLPDRPRAPSRPQPCGRVRGRRSPPLSPPDPHPPLRAHRYGSGCGRCRR
jgi:hypothetical protein